MSAAASALEQITQTGHGPDVAHTAPPGAITTARELGVQYRTDCGLWRWPPERIRNLRTRADLAPNTCPLCLIVRELEAGEAL